MILSFAKNTVSTSFEKGCIPRLLTASNITVGFSQHPRILHNHDDRMELLYIRTGSGSYIVGDECYDIRPGNIIVCNPGILHDELPEHNRHLSMLSLAVTDLKIKGFPKSAKNSISVSRICLIFLRKSWGFPPCSISPAGASGKRSPCSYFLPDLSLRSPRKWALTI